MNAITPELIVDYACAIGEGPLWHSVEQALFWVDIPAGRLFRYHPASGEHSLCYAAAEPIGGFTIQADGALLLFMARGMIRRWHGGDSTTLVLEVPEERDTRFNDVIADPLGRVLCGTMATQSRPGRLYRLDTDASLILLLDDVGISNGLGFSPDRTALYYTDSIKREIYRFDYDVERGALSNRRIFARLEPEDGLPDGLTVDAEGCVWSARWDGSSLVRYSPSGALLSRFVFPVKKVTCATFGGSEYDVLYVTTAGGEDKSAEGASAGALYRLRLGIRGRPEFMSRIAIRGVSLAGE